MTTSSKMATALLTEHFRYTPLTLLDDIINVVNELVFRAIDAIDDGLAPLPPESLGFRLDDAQIRSLPTREAREEALYEAKKTEIDNGIVQLESLLNATVDKDFDKLEIYTLRNILSMGHEEEDLARWVQLQHYKKIDLESTTAVSAPSPEQIQLQRRKLQETAKLNAMLQAEEARNTAVLAQLRSLGGSNGAATTSSPATLAFLNPPSDLPSTAKPLTQNVQYALDQLPAMRALLTQLKSSLQTVPHAREAREETESVAAQRGQYVAARSRRVLQRRGVEPESASSLAAASGRRIGRDEVQGLEAVVRALGGGDGRRREGDGGEGDDDMGEDDARRSGASSRKPLDLSKHLVFY